MNLSRYICHSGGADGADMMWETEGYKYGVKTIGYSFWNHTQKSKNQKILTVDELNEGFENVKIANKSLGRNPESIQYQYVKNLLSRNWFQVKNSESIYAVGKLKNHNKIVDGGTGWAVQMGIDNNKNIFVFDQPTDSWYKYIYELSKFEKLYVIPKLTTNFAGIGTRELTHRGKEAIKEIYKCNSEIE